MKRFRRSPSFLLLVCLVASCGRGDYSHVRNLDSRGEKIVCLGDSLTAGLGAAKGEDYPSVLARGFPYPVVNAGRSGDTSADGLERLERDVIAENPRLVIVLLGGNDFLRQVPVAETKKNLTEIVRRAQEGGAMVALVGLRLGLFTDEYGPLYEAVAAERGALYIPEILSGLASDHKMMSDRIHPNGAGYKVIAERILKALKPLLEEAERRRKRRG